MNHLLLHEWEWIYAMTVLGYFLIFDPPYVRENYLFCVMIFSVFSDLMNIFSTQFNFY